MSDYDLDLQGVCLRSGSSMKDGRWGSRWIVQVNAGRHLPDMRAVLRHW
jgi:hypothetical protein